ncbi:hypothetical protein BEWA_006760 [Theileria equi strain WA]|uniref:OTU domain-containing protein n=1 Tax=Theileria equi strain WA TaxID=1537102 RepID=L0B083_THEEQ|nr:hypothetical protein BEWA_006760 [Theileria equi strain WA]AFZ81267.1 hypothetical protein BEWA_006760 [Theileria equi strain WA]|eukprot:XP_004830933.1 hypothetical protein BEWA_006760 [Theileria equi strain WA]
MQLISYRWAVLLSIAVNVQLTLPLSRFVAINRNNHHSLENYYLRAHLGDRSYSFLSTPLEFSLFKTEKDACSRFGNWSSAKDTWKRYLSPQNWILCHKDYGSDGNCFYHATAGLLRDTDMKGEAFSFPKTLPAGILTSVENLPKNNSYFTHEELRVLAAIYFIGVNPHDQDAVSHFDKDKFKEKLEFVRDMQAVERYPDLKWQPEERLKELESGRDPLDIAKMVYNDISSSRPVKTWASHSDMIALSHILNIAFFIIPSNSQRVQLVKHDDSLPKFTLSLYYTNMLHFEGAGFARTTDSRLFSVIQGYDIPSVFSQLLPKTNNS